MPKSEKRATIFVNGKRASGKAINVPKKWPDFLKTCSKKLGINAARVYNDVGGELDDVDLICSNDVLFVSAGESYIIPTTTDREGNDSDWVTLNVGGRTFSTTISTLLSHKESMLAKMFGESWNSTRDTNGSYLIDRTPEYFAPILNYLRCGVLVIDDGVNAEGVLNEAKFFNITAIIDRLTAIVERRSKVDVFSRKDVVSILLTSSTNSSLRCQGLNLSGVDLSKLDLSHINFKMTNFSETNLSRCNLNHAQLQEADLQGADLAFANLRNGNLQSANLEGANLRAADLTFTNFSGANAKGLRAEEANFSDANMRACNLKAANLENCNLRNADLAGANLEDCNLRGANLHKSNLSGANLRGANFDIRTVSSR